MIELINESTVNTYEETVAGLHYRYVKTRSTSGKSLNVEVAQENNEGLRTVIACGDVSPARFFVNVFNDNYVQQRAAILDAVIAAADELLCAEEGSDEE